MSRIDEALDRYEEAAARRGYVIGHSQEEYYNIDDGQIFSRETPFKESQHLNEFLDRGFKCPDEYLAHLRRWNAMAIVDGHENSLQQCIGLEISLFSSEDLIDKLDWAITLTEDSCDPGSPGEILENTYVTFSSYECWPANYSLGSLRLRFRADGSQGERIFRTAFEGDPFQPFLAFESFANLIECCAEGLERGLATDGFEDFEADWENTFAWRDIFLRKNPDCEIWKKDIKFFKKLQARPIETVETDPFMQAIRKRLTELG